MILIFGGTYFSIVGAKPTLFGTAIVFCYVPEPRLSQQMSAECCRISADRDSTGYVQYLDLSLLTLHHTF